MTTPQNPTFFPPPPWTKEGQEWFKGLPNHALKDPVPRTIVDALVADLMDAIPEPFGDYQNYMKIIKSGNIEDPQRKKMVAEIHSLDTAIDDFSEAFSWIPGVGQAVDAATQIAEFIFPGNLLVFLKSNPGAMPPIKIQLPPPPKFPKIKIPLPPQMRR